MLLGRHTDDQYTDFISRQAQKGWWLSKIEGNIFTFKNHKNYWSFSHETNK